jgi:hypothetical protein
MLEQPVVRFAVPQVLTATRLVLGTVALINAMDGRTDMAATMITSFDRHSIITPVTPRSSETTKSHGLRSTLASYSQAEAFDLNPSI